MNFKQIKNISYRNVLGFTLIELLVVIAIIGVLATVSLVGFSSAKSKSRDARTLSDMNSLKKALSVFNQNQEPPSYPVPETWAALYNNTWLAKYTGITQQQPPKNDANSYYFYAVSSDPEEGYYIGGTIENGNDALKTDIDDAQATIRTWADLTNGGKIIGINGLGNAIADTVPDCRDTGTPPTRGVWCLKME